MVHDESIDAYMSVSPLNSKITADAVASTALARGEPRFLPYRRVGSDRARHPAVRRSEEIPGALSVHRRRVPATRSRRSRGVNHLLIARSSLSETAVGTFVRQLFAVRPSLAKGTAGGRGESRSRTPTRTRRCRAQSWSGRLYRRHRSGPFSISTATTSGPASCCCRGSDPAPHGCAII